MSIFRKKGVKKVWIKDNWFVIKKLTPLDFIDTGIPFTFFSLKNIYAKKISKEQKEKEIQDKIKTMKAVILAGLLEVAKPIGKMEDDFKLTDKDKVIDLFFQEDTIFIGIALYQKIISNSLSLFMRLITADRNTLIYWGTMAAKFGRSPIECLLPHGGYTDLDAYLFNSFVFNIYSEEEVRQYNKLTKRK